MTRLFYSSEEKSRPDAQVAFDGQPAYVEVVVRRLIILCASLFLFQRENHVSPTTPFGGVELQPYLLFSNDSITVSYASPIGL